MRLLNGVVFGIGIGLVTTGILEMANEHSTMAYALGAMLILAETGRLLYFTCGRAGQTKQRT